ncbi:MAG TPA: LLM class flavin-dependent oxidoreductase [Anaerolineales bacterium]|nr:LLM class flavin-dependent oxidoreductase [Anaerolineales bacterium]
MSTMRFGLALPYGSARRAAEMACLAEEAGWDGCFLGDAIWCEDSMIALAAAAMVTHRIRLGTMIIPAPLRKPWKVASESVALDHLSGGRLTLGLGAGAVWMGWQGFPDEVTDAKTRAEMLDESIDILTLLYQRKQFDYDGLHYHLKLTLVDEMYYPPKPVQQPRIPLWVTGLWPRKKSMQRVLKCDGVLVEKMNPEGQSEEVTPADIRAIKAYVDANRILTTPFDIVVGGKTTGLDQAQLQGKLLPWKEAGTTWWIEGLIEEPEERAMERIRGGPPRLD